MKNLVFNPIRNISIKYYANKKVFNPTRTSKIIIKAIYKKRKLYFLPASAQAIRSIKLNKKFETNKLP